MIGAIYGDIAGSKYEFHNIRTKNFTLLDRGCEFTDDSVCTIAVMDWLLHSKVLNAKSITEYMLKWTRKYPYAGYGGRFRHWILSNHQEPYGSYGNGSAMRISPIAWVAKDLKELEELSDMVTSITHNHPEGLKGALVTATCIYLALHGASKKEIEEYAVSKYPEIKLFEYEWLRENYKFNETCQRTVPQAIYCFLISKDFEDCIKTTISVGGDCDTSSAISGAIAEAYYGISEDNINKAKSFLDDEMKEIVDLFEKRYPHNK